MSFWLKLLEMGWIKKRVLLAKINKAHEHWRKIAVRYELFEKKGGI
jgi:hypothetical protein